MDVQGQDDLLSNLYHVGGHSGGSLRSLFCPLILFNPFLSCGQCIFFFFFVNSRKASFQSEREREDGEYVVCGVVVCGPCLARRPSICRGSASRRWGLRQTGPLHSLDAKKGLSLTLCEEKERNGGK